MLKQKYHNIIYLSGISLLLVGLPLSPFLMSISQFILLGNWIIEGGYARKIKTLRSNIPAVLIILLFFLHLVWLLNTSDFDYAIKDIVVKLPLFVLPFVFGSAIALKKSTLNNFLILFVAAVFIGSMVSMVRYWGWIGGPVSDIREISVIISHIRFSLMVCLSAFISGYLILQKEVNTKIKITLAPLLMWNIVFLFILGSMTGIVIFILTGLAILLIYNPTNPPYRVIVYLITVLVPLVFLALFINTYQRQFSEAEPKDIARLDKNTQYGNRYYHSKKSDIIENGRHVYHHICEKELIPAWNQRSAIKYGSKDKSGHPVKATLYRYITSKGLRKDKSGMDNLTDEDIEAVENGITNINLVNTSGFYKRFHQTVWEVGSYINGVSPNGNSLTQRLEYWKAGLAIVKENAVFGVGTGDLQQSFDEQYEKMNSMLSAKNRHRGHNQYLTFWIAFGFAGFLFFLWAMIYPVLKIKNKASPLFIVFMMIALLSFMNEDTLESQAGVTFFAGFFSLLTSVDKRTKVNFVEVNNLL